MNIKAGKFCRGTLIGMCMWEELNSLQVQHLDHPLEIIEKLKNGSDQL